MPDDHSLHRRDVRSRSAPRSFRSLTVRPSFIAMSTGCSLAALLYLRYACAEPGSENSLCISAASEYSSLLALAATFSSRTSGTARPDVLRSRSSEYSLIGSIPDPLSS